MIAHVAQRGHTTASSSSLPGHAAWDYTDEIYDQFYLGAAGSSSSVSSIGELGFAFIDEPLFLEGGREVDRPSGAIGRMRARVEYSSTSPALDFASAQGARLPRLFRFENLSYQYRRWTELLEYLMEIVRVERNQVTHLQTINAYRLPFALPAGEVPAPPPVDSEPSHPKVIFVDDQGGPTGFAAMEIMTQEELEAEGFPYYASSEESEQAKQSLRELYKKARARKTLPES